MKAVTILLFSKRHHQTFGLGEALLISVERQEFCRHKVVTWRGPAIVEKYAAAWNLYKDRNIHNRIPAST